MFLIRFYVRCNRCKKLWQRDHMITEWGGNQIRDNRNALIDAICADGWQVNWDAYRGFTGPVVCAECLGCSNG